MRRAPRGALVIWQSAGLLLAVVYLGERRRCLLYRRR